MTRYATLLVEARNLASLIAASDDCIVLRPGGGETCEGDIVLSSSADGDEVTLTEAGCRAPFVHPTIDAYLAEREASANWTE